MWITYESRVSRLGLVCLVSVSFVVSRWFLSARVYLKSAISPHTINIHSSKFKFTCVRYMLLLFAFFTVVCDSDHDDNGQKLSLAWWRQSNIDHWNRQQETSILWIRTSLIERCCPNWDSANGCWEKSILEPFSTAFRIYYLPTHANPWKNVLSN